MSSLVRTGTAVPTDQQSALPTVRGVPWFGAVGIAVVLTAIGAALGVKLEDGNTSGLGLYFKVGYLAGCVLAALAVRRRALFTAAAQPPLIAFFVGIITLYALSGNDAKGVKAIVLKVVLPIATSFPWILLTFLLTLAVVVARWYFTRIPSAKPAGSKSGAKKSGAKKSRGAKAKSAGSGSNGTRSKKGTSSTRRPAPVKAASERSEAAEPPKRNSAISTRKAPAPRPKPALDFDDEPLPPRRPAQPRPAPEPTRPAPAPAAASSGVRKAASAVTNSQSRPVRRTPPPGSEPTVRAKPQTIAPRGQGDRLRRTAGQQLRDQGIIEDLATGIDDAPRRSH
ncbi:MAG: hypothetical protein QM658_12675 [Gordonia sp. (in: high G+C Gram-positive bacteria)]